MILLIEHRVDWELIRQRKQTQNNRDNNCENKHRVEYDYKVGYDVMLTNHTAYKYETPYKGPVAITQCFTNGTVNFQYGVIKIKYNIRRIKPYKFDTKVEEYNSINMHDAVNILITSHILLYYFKAWNKVYDQMYTATFDVN